MQKTIALTCFLQFDDYNENHESRMSIIGPDSSEKWSAAQTVFLFQLRKLLPIY